MNVGKRRDPGKMVAIGTIILVYVIWFQGMKAVPEAAEFQSIERSVKDFPTSMALKTKYEEPSEAAKSGQKVYEQYCIGCHGVSGSGDGVAAAFLDPKPRNFNTGVFKFTSSVQGTLPTHEDLMKTVTEGLPGSSMPSFRLLPEAERKNVVEFILHLTRNVRYFKVLNAIVTDAIISADEEDPFTKEVLKEALDDDADILIVQEAKAMFPQTVEPELDSDSLVAGRLTFLKSCKSCHGEAGQGQTMRDPDGKVQLDDFKEPSRPRDLTTGIFRHGTDSRSIWYRIKRGLDGAIMPTTGSASSDDAWHTAHYVQLLFDASLQKKY
ncbi:MAG: c-type cytochrome, partial [Planctomycetota bacterium]|nr:c-type cytochrome [Planctomycetota bacterium]